MFKKSQLTSKKFAQKKRKFFFIKALFFLVLFILAGVSFFYLLRLKNITISEVELRGNVIVGTEDVLSFINEELGGSYYAFFPKNNIFLYPKEDIEAKMLDKWKRVESVDVLRNGLTGITVNVTEKKPRFLWCRETIEGLSREGDCYFIDDKGYLFSKAPGFSEDVYFRFFGNISAADPIGQRYLEESKFKSLSDFTVHLEQAKIKASKMLAKENGEYELYLSEFGRVFINDRQDFEKTFENLKTLLESDVFKREVKGASSSLDYIDLRYGNKVYYKFK